MRAPFTTRVGLAALVLMFLASNGNSSFGQSAPPALDPQFGRVIFYTWYAGKGDTPSLHGGPLVAIDGARVGKCCQEPNNKKLYYVADVEPGVRKIGVVSPGLFADKPGRDAHFNIQEGQTVYFLFDLEIGGFLEPGKWTPRLVDPVTGAEDVSGLDYDAYSN